MMQAAAFDQWCHRLGLGPEPRACLARLRASPPVRRVQGRAQNVSGTYASRKMGMTIQFESHKVELWAIYAMEYDAHVLEYFDQPDTLTLTYQSPSGRTVVASHTPDFLVLRQDSVGFEELSLSRLNHWLPRGQTHTEVMERTTDFHHEIADALLPQADPVFDDATAFDTTVDMLNAQSAIVQGLVGPLLFQGEFLAAWLLGRHEDL